MEMSGNERTIKNFGFTSAKSGISGGQTVSLSQIRTLVDALMCKFAHPITILSPNSPDEPVGEGEVGGRLPTSSTGKSGRTRNRVKPRQSPTPSTRMATNMPSESNRRRARGTASTPKAAPRAAVHWRTRSYQAFGMLKETPSRIETWMAKYTTKLKDLEIPRRTSNPAMATVSGVGKLSRAGG